MAKRLSDANSDSIVTTEYVLMELGSLLSRGHARQMFIQLFNILGTDTDTEIVPASEDLLLDGFALFSKRLDKEW